MHVTKIGDFGVSITECICCYPNLHEPREVRPGAAPKYSAAFILPKTMDYADWDILNGIVADLIRSTWPKNVPNLRSPFKDTQSVNQRGEVYFPEFPGQYFVNASAEAKSPPQVVRENPKEPATPGECYPGCGVNVYLGLFAYDRESVGIGVGLNAVQIANRSLPRLGGQKPADEVFGQISAPATATVPGMVVPGAPAPVSPTPHQPAPAAPVAQPAPAAPVAQPAPAAPVAPGVPGPGPTLQ